MKKYIIVLFISVTIFLLLLFSLVVFAGNKNQESKLEDKVTQEIDYLDKYLVSLLGDFNGLNIENNLKEEKSSNLQIETEQTSVKNTTQDNQSNSNNNEISSQENVQSEGSSQGSSTQGKQQNNGNLNNQSNNNLRTNNSILANQGNYITNWESIQNQIEELYQTWNTISIDLHSLNVDGSSILAFSDFLNNSTQNIKNKDKEKSMDAIIKLYQLLPKYSESYNSNSKETNMLKIQCNVVTAYVNVSNEKWQDAKNQLIEASSQFTNLLNSVEQSFQNQTTVNQCYVLVNELNKAVGLKDKDIFFIEYQNLMEKMEVI